MRTIIVMVVGVFLCTTVYAADPFVVRPTEDIQDLDSATGCTIAARINYDGSYHAYPISTGSSDSTGSRDHRPDHRTGIRTTLGPPNTLQMASAGHLIREKMLNSNIVRG